MSRYIVVPRDVVKTRIDTTRGSARRANLRAVFLLLFCVRAYTTARIGRKLSAVTIYVVTRSCYQRNSKPRGVQRVVVVVFVLAVRAYHAN